MATMDGLFDWDGANIEHIAEHGVSPDEAEEALLDARRIPAASYGVADERRRAVIGVTETGRLLIVVYTRRRNMIRVITASDASDAAKRQYRRRRR